MVFKDIFQWQHLSRYIREAASIASTALFTPYNLVVLKMSIMVGKARVNAGKFGTTAAFDIKKYKD